MAVDVLKDSIKESFARKFPGEEFVNMTNKATISGTVYNVGMMLPFGSTGGLPDFPANNHCAGNPCLCAEVA